MLNITYTTITDARCIKFGLEMDCKHIYKYAWRIGC